MKSNNQKVVVYFSNFFCASKYIANYLFLILIHFVINYGNSSITISDEPTSTLHKIGKCCCLKLMKGHEALCDPEFIIIVT